MFVNSSTWTDIVYQLKLDADNFIKNNKEYFVDMFKAGNPLSQVIIINTMYALLHWWLI